MKDLNAIRERFLQEGPEMRLGHLASDLARIASLMGRETENETAKGVMEEAKFFAEWTATSLGVDLETQMTLAEIQGYVAQKQLELNLRGREPQWRKQVSGHLRTCSNGLLEKAGFLEPDA